MCDMATLMRLISEASTEMFLCFTRCEHRNDSLGSQYHCEAGRMAVSPYHAGWGLVLPKLHIAFHGCGPTYHSSNTLLL